MTVHPSPPTTSSTPSAGFSTRRRNPPAASELGAIKPEAFQAADASTVKVKLDSPIVELPSILATKHGMVVKNGASSDDIRFRPNGTGAVLAEGAEARRPQDHLHAQ